MEPKQEASPARRSLQPPRIESGKNEKLSGFPSLQKDSFKEPESKEQLLQQHLGSGSQLLLITKELPSMATRQHCSSPSPSPGREPGSKPCAADPSLGLQDPPKPTTVHSESSIHKSRPGPDPGPPKSKHPDRPLSSQKPSAGTVVVREPGMQSPGGPSQEAKGSSKGMSDAFPALPCSPNTATDVIGRGGSGPSVSLPPEGVPLDTKLKPTGGGHPLEMLEKSMYLPRQGHPGVSESVDQKLPTVSEKLNLSPKHPKPSTVKDGSPPCRQMDKSPSPQPTTTDRKSEGKKCTEVLHVPADSRKLETSLSLAHGEARLKGTERAPAAVGKGLPEAKGKGLSPQKPPTEAGKPSGMRRSPSATGQSSFRSTALPEKSLSYSSSFPEVRLGVREASTTSSDTSSAKANGATTEPTAPSNKDHRKALPGSDGGTQMTKSDSLPSFRSSTITLESHHPNPNVAGGAGPRDRALSVTATAGETKGKEPTPGQPPQTRKQNVGREATRLSPVPSTDRPIALSSEKDFVVRQRRGKESLRSSPHKKAS